MICPFCRETEIGDDTGPTVCPACKAGFEIDDRGECVFVNTDSAKDADVRAGLHSLWSGAAGQTEYLRILRDNFQQKGTLKTYEN